MTELLKFNPNGQWELNKATATDVAHEHALPKPAVKEMKVPGTSHWIKHTHSKKDPMGGTQHHYEVSHGDKVVGKAHYVATPKGSNRHVEVKMHPEHHDTGAGAKIHTALKNL